MEEMVEKPIRPENELTINLRKKEKRVTKCIISGHHHKIGKITMSYVYNNLGYHLILYTKIKGVFYCLQK